MTIKGSVGKGGKNDAEDVKKVRALLIRHRQWAGADLRTTQTTAVSDAFIAAIVAFQKSACATLTQDGRVDPGGFTYKRLSMQMIPKPKNKVFNNVCWNPGDALSDADFEAAAKTLACEKEAIQAVAIVETRAKAHDSMGRPAILFERHKFKKFTSGRYSATHPDLSGAAGGYSPFEKRYSKLYRAAVLDEAAALKSCSWGAFQMMGFNHAIAGYDTVGAMVSAFIGSQAKQLEGFVAFVNASAGMKKAIQNKDWATFARLYNGPAYAKNAYDTKMAAEYAKLKPVKPATPNKAAAAAEKVGN